MAKSELRPDAQGGAFLENRRSHQKSALSRSRLGLELRCVKQSRDRGSDLLTGGKIFVIRRDAPWAS